MALDVITDGHHLQQRATDCATQHIPSYRAEMSKSVLVGLAREHCFFLSHVNPRAAASRVRQMFSGHSRHGHTHLVRWPQLASSELFRTDIVESMVFHCAPTQTVLKAHSMFNSQCLQSLLRSLVVWSALRVVFVQETHAPTMGTLLVDQLFRYDGHLDNYGRQAWFLIRVSIESSCIAGVEYSHRKSWILVSSVVYVCSFYAPHVGTDVDVCVAF